MLFYEFQTILRDAKEYSATQLQSKLTQLNVQLQTVEGMLSQQSGLVERMIVSASDTLEARQEQILQIQNGPLLTQKNLLKQHHQQKSDSAVALLTVAKITEQKKLIDRLNRDITQIKTQIAHEAKRVVATVKEHDRVQSQVQYTQLMLDLHSFLATLNRTPSDIAADEVETYYYLFEKR